MMTCLSCFSETKRTKIFRDYHARNTRFNSPEGCGYNLVIVAVRLSIARG